MRACGRAEVTVAVPTFRGASTLAETLGSIRAQREVDFDLLICDDRSDDGTLGVARRAVGDARIEVSDSRLGLAGNWNRCVERASAPFVAIVHQDDLISDPKHLRLHLDRFQREPDLAMTVSGASAIDEKGNDLGRQIEQGWLGPIDRTFGPGTLATELSVSNPIRCSAVVLKRNAFLESGGFDGRWRYVVDWEFWLRLSSRCPVGWIARETVKFRWHAGSETQRFKGGLEDLEEQERLLGRLGAGDWRPRLGRAYLNRAYEASKAGHGELARRAWKQARSLWPGVWWRLASDPRLAARMLRL